MAKIVKTMDGCEAAAYIAYGFTEVAGIYPISPSSVISEHVDDWAAKGKKNIFGQSVSVTEMQSEAGAAGFVHGSLSVGALTSTYTASQGLLLMIPNMYKMAGELLPAVFHVTARTVATHALSIFCDHSDVMACRQTGFAILFGSSVQAVMDMGAVAHLSAIKGRVPFMSVQDGYRTSHEIQKIEVLDYNDLQPLIDQDALEKFRGDALNPEHPTLRGSAQNDDIFFQSREAANSYYNDLPEIVENYMNDINKLTGRDYKLFNYNGAEDATSIIISMGSVSQTVRGVVDYLNANGEKVGMINVRLFRPFSMKHLLSVLPKSVTKICVLDRTKEPGSLGEPLYQDICTTVIENNLNIQLIAGRYGLASKDVTPAQIVACFKNLNSDKPKNHFTIGINDDVTFLSLEVGEEIDILPNDMISCKFWGLGSDGTVGANKNSIKIIGENTDKFVQAYFAYDSKKSGGITTSHLRFGNEKIIAPYLVKKADFVACHNASYVNKYDMVSDLKENGSFLLNCGWDEKEIQEKLPMSMKELIIKNKIKVFTIDGNKIAQELGLGGRVNTILQASFFKLSEVVPIEEAVVQMKSAIDKSYGRKGEKVLKMNYSAVDAGVKEVREVNVTSDWLNEVVATNEIIKKEVPKLRPNFIKTILDPVNAQAGNFLPVSTFLDYADGHLPSGTSEYEKRGIATHVPVWKKENCIQCNQCAYVCPHAVIRPFLATDEELKDAPAGFETIKAVGKGMENYNYRIQVDALDCTGCTVCTEVCPAPNKAIVMEPIENSLGQKEGSVDQMENWYYALKLYNKENPMDKTTVKGSQFEQPLLEFSGACAGCGETPYSKLVTQLFGDRMYIANATGCSSIWGGSSPATPYTTNGDGQGPAWANSLFEDNAEFGMGMHLAVKKLREKLKLKVIEFIEKETLTNENKSIMQDWLDNYNKGEASKKPSNEVVKLLELLKSSNKLSALGQEILDNKDQLVQKSFWIIGGDGWAYDIGFGGLDHVVASGENINILVLDTEVYSNTGGQSSKATPAAAVAKFASSGKKIRKKDLGLMVMNYGYVYVAQVAQGANQSQLIKALVEAEAYEGPSLVICYAPCIAQGIKTGMGTMQQQTKKAVECGYWHMYRYNPKLEEQGKNPFILDSKEPKSELLKEFMNSEVRYASLALTFPDVADEMFEQAKEASLAKYKIYKEMADRHKKAKV